MNIVYGFTVVFFLIDSLNDFDIKNQMIKSFVYFGLLIGTPITLIWNLVVIKLKSKRVIGVIIPTIILALILIVGLNKIIFSTGVWQTETILYQNQHLKFKTVEFQIQDIGALGYNKRTVEVFYLIPFFMITSELPNDLDKRVEWMKVDKNVDELGLKFP